MNRNWTLDVALLALRFTGLGLAWAHGFSKLINMVTGQGGRFVEAVGNMGFPAPLVFAWAAALAESVGGLCVFAGLLTRVAAAVAAFSMVVAAFVRHHAHDQLLVELGLREASAETLKAWGNPELAFLYLLPLLALALTGAGRISLDHLLRGRGRGR